MQHTVISMCPEHLLLSFVRTSASAGEERRASFQIAAVRAAIQQTHLQQHHTSSQDAGHSAELPGIWIAGAATRARGLDMARLAGYQPADSLAGEPLSF